jgi:hypothetical protein
VQNTFQQAKESKYKEKKKPEYIYELQWNERVKFYIGRTARNFETWYKAHMHDIEHNKEKSNLTNTFLDTLQWRSVTF